MSCENLTQAVNLFVMTKFDKCLRECNKVIRRAKCEPEQERNHKIIEAATALGIQALAETDEWCCVVTFITDVYGSVDMCPPSIIQLCILLHAQVKEYLPCQKLVKIWLMNPHNIKHELCSQVVNTFAQYVLVPTGSLDLLKEMVWSCPSLTHAERTSLLQLSQSKHQESRIFDPESSCPASPDDVSSNVSEHVSERSQTRLDQSIQSTVSSHMQDGCNITNNNTRNPEHEDRKKITDFSALLRWLYETVVVRAHYIRHPGFQLLLMAVFALLALFQTQTGDPVSSLARLVILWRTFLQKLRLFYLCA